MPCFQHCSWLTWLGNACTKKVDSAESKSTPTYISSVTKRIRTYAITDMTKHQAAMDLFYTIVKMPSFDESHTRIAKTAPATQFERDEQDWLTRWMPIQGILVI